ncbi:MAG: hypothetical protein ON057_001641 [Glomeribacter sp. 1016415]|nr:hypothetical protein [Glomeribacter sp. 1016415]
MTPSSTAYSPSMKRKLASWLSSGFLMLTQFSRNSRFWDIQSMFIQRMPLALPRKTERAQVKKVDWIQRVDQIRLF